MQRSQGLHIHLANTLIKGDKMTTSRALHIYTVSFKTKEKYPSTRINYHHMNVVADTVEIAEEVVRQTQGDVTITDIKYFCTAMELQ